MSRELNQRVLLVTSYDAATPWPLSSLRDQLNEQGHHVTVLSDPAEVVHHAATVDVTHAFGWTAARAVADSALQVPWVLTASWSAVGEDSGIADVARSAELVLCPSSASADAANRLGVSRQRCLVMPLGVDVDVFTRLGPSANRTTNQRIVVRAVGPEDGVLDVVAALPAIPGAELVVLVGPGASGELERHHQSLLDAAQDAGVRARVALVTARDPLETAWLLRSADVVVSVARQVGDHALVAEAMSCGKACVVTPIGASRDLVVHDVTGLHVPPGRVRPLALSVRHLLREPFRLEGMGLAGADRARSRCAWPRVAHEFASVYARVAGRQAAIAEDTQDEMDVGLTQTGVMRNGPTSAWAS